MMWKAKAWFRPPRRDMLSQCPGWVSLGNQAGGKVAADNVSLHPEHASSERLGRDSDVAAKTGEPKPWPRLCASHVMRNVMQGPKLDQDGCDGPAVLVSMFFPQLDKIIIQSETFPNKVCEPKVRSRYFSSVIFHGYGFVVDPRPIDLGRV